MKIKYFTFVLLITLNACSNNLETAKEQTVKYVEQEDEAVLNELFEQKKDVFSRSSVQVDLYKKKDDQLSEEIGQIYWYQHWTFDTLKNEYIPSRNSSCRLINENPRITLWQENRYEEGVKYYDMDEIQEWYSGSYLIVKEKRQGEKQYKAEGMDISMKNRGWLFTTVTAFSYGKEVNENGVISLKVDPRNISRVARKKELLHTKKYYCKFTYSNILLSPKNEEIIREFGEL